MLARARAREQKLMTEGAARRTEWNGGAQPSPLPPHMDCTADRARGSLITYVSKIIPCTPIVYPRQSQAEYVTTTRARSTFAPVYSKTCWRGFTLVTLGTDLVERSKRARCVSIRLIEWRAYRTILSNNNGYRHAQHATTSPVQINRKIITTGKSNYARARINRELSIAVKIIRWKKMRRSS